MVDELRFQKTIISMTGSYNMKCESIKVTIKQESEEYTATNNTQPYAIALGAESFEIELSGVDPEHRDYFNLIYANQKQSSEVITLPNLFTYGYSSQGEIHVLEKFGYCIVEEISKENNEPFDVKLKALRRWTPNDTRPTKYQTKK